MLNNSVLKTVLLVMKMKINNMQVGSRPGNSGAGTLHLSLFGVSVKEGYGSRRLILLIKSKCIS